ncbi:uncharacterized protein [Palaemon carinicauda]|uniref:uncharacterized protein n=1 Tax=Palaemon carinicauda TaxID=392227 RepID=UPI0035B63B6B
MAVDDSAGRPICSPKPRIFSPQECVLRGRSRLSDAPQESGYMDPILLESHCALWRLIVEHWHEVLLHCNTSTLLVHLRKEFWVPRMRQQVKKILKWCLHCKRVQGQPYPTPPLAPVHPNRLNAEVPFRVTGLDYTGGFKVPRSHVDMVYVLLFTCAAMRAVALETTTSLTVVELVQAIRRDQLAKRNDETTADARSPVVIAAPRHDRPTRASAERTRALFQEIL